MLVIAGETMSSYGMLVPSMITISVASVIIGAHIIYRSQPATRADSPVHCLRLRDAMSTAPVACCPMSAP
jgi:hypothetical protein